MNTCIQMNPLDNVATVLARIEQGKDIAIVDPHMKRLGSITAGESIPFGHKISLIHLPTGTPIVKYGETIGKATIPIQGGVHVHVHNVQSLLNA